MEPDRVEQEFLAEGRVGENVEFNPPRPARTIKDVNQEERDVTIERLQNGFLDFNFEFEIQGPLLTNLPKFEGIAGDTPYMHLSSLQMHCRMMKPRNMSVEDCMWKIFHLTLEGKAREWFLSLPRFVDDANASWKNLRRAFLNQYFPSTKSSVLRRK